MRIRCLFLGLVALIDAVAAQAAGKLLIVADEWPQMEVLGAYLAEKGGHDVEKVEQTALPKSLSAYEGVFQFVHGRLDDATAEALMAFTVSLPFDRRLALVDIAGSRAHVRGLARVGLLDDDERVASRQLTHSLYGAAGMLGLPGFIWKLLALALIWAYLQHFIAGIRHLYMDVNHAVSKEFGRSSALATLVLSLGLTVVLGAKLFGLY